MKTRISSAKHQGLRTIAMALPMCLLALASCKDKPQTTDIIVKKPAAKAARRSVQKMGDYEQARKVQWLGAEYGILVERKADTSLPQATDEQGNPYYDNRITLTIRRPDGTVFFQRTFSKADFAQYIDDSAANGALLGIVFDRIDGGSLKFAASVGSPDKMSDEYVPMVLTVTRGGTVSIERDTQLDTASDTDADDDTNADGDDDGV